MTAHASETRPALGSVVIVDDCKTVLAGARAAFVRAGFEVTTATDPSLVDPKQLHHVDMIVVDVNMQEVFGDDVVGFFRTVWNVSAPIYLFSTIELQELSLRASRAGATGAFCKSTGFDGLVEQAVRIVHQRDSAGTK